MTMNDHADRPVNTDVRFNKHPKRKNNEQTAAMYAAYASGKSVCQVAKLYRMDASAIRQRFKNRGYPMRPRYRVAFQVIDGIRFADVGRGYFREGRPLQRYAQQYVWVKHNGPVPQGFIVVHRNRNRGDNRIGNLYLISKKNAPKEMNPLRHNQFTAPNGSRRKAGDRIKAEREARWKRAQDL